MQSKHVVRQTTKPGKNLQRFSNAVAAQLKPLETRFAARRGLFSMPQNIAAGKHAVNAGQEG